jgi:hypothetical protein
MRGLKSEAARGQTGPLAVIDGWREYQSTCDCTFMLHACQSLYGVPRTRPQATKTPRVCNTGVYVTFEGVLP